jgi:hypothetical protein
MKTHIIRQGIILFTIVLMLTILVFDKFIHVIIYAVPTTGQVETKVDPIFLSQSSPNTKEKILVATMRSQNVHVQPQLVNLYKPYVRSADYVMTHPNAKNLGYAFQLQGIKGVEYFSLSDIRANIASLKSNGVNFISYDLEETYSAPGDLIDPVNSMKQASNIVHQSGLKLIATPSHKLTDKFAPNFAAVADLYILQAQAYQSNSSSYQVYVNNMTSKLKAAHLGMPVIAELSTARGDLASMKKSFSLVANVVDGVTSWYANTPDGLNQLNAFLSWFQQNYR